VFDSIVEILKDSKLRQTMKYLNKEERADEVARLMKLKDEEKTKFASRINEDLQIFFDLQRFGELQQVDDWNEDENMEHDLMFIENKMKEVITGRQQSPIEEILKKQHNT